MKKIQLEIGTKFGKWTVIGIGKKYMGRSSSLCICGCGTERIVANNNLKIGLSKGCGCERIGPLQHGYATDNKKVYLAWKNMKSRCLNKNRREYKNYGGRGISVCHQWADSFETFLKDMGEPGHKMTLDRIDNNGNYEPGNCRWTDMKTQCRNTRDNVYLIIGEDKKTPAEWAEISGVKTSTLFGRIRRGWSARDAVFSPVQSGVRI